MNTFERRASGYWADNPRDVRQCNRCGGELPECVGGEECNIEKCPHIDDEDVYLPYVDGVVTE